VHASCPVWGLRSREGRGISIFLYAKRSLGSSQQAAHSTLHTGSGSLAAEQHQMIEEKFTEERGGSESPNFRSSFLYAHHRVIPASISDQRHIQLSSIFATCAKEKGEEKGMLSGSIK